MNIVDMIEKEKGKGEIEIMVQQRSFTYHVVQVLPDLSDYTRKGGAKQFL